MCLGECADNERRGCADDPADVVGKSLGGAANRGGENLGSHGTESAEVSTRKERNRRSEGKKYERGTNRDVEKQQHRRKKEIGDVGPLSSDPVADETERDVAEPHSKLHHENHGRARQHLEAESAAR